MRAHVTPDSADGRQVLAHELTHVVQQLSGPVDGTPTGDGVSVSDPHDRFEQQAEANAAALTTHDDEAVQTLPLQRQELTEEEAEESEK